MRTLFDSPSRDAILRRLDALSANAARQWGKMNAGQMLAHCRAALEVATGDEPRKQALIGKLLGRFVRSSMLGEKPFRRNSPTDPSFVITDPRDFAREKERLRATIARFCERGPDVAARRTHTFLGRISGEEWGVLMHKHLDHHFQQFGA